MDGLKIMYKDICQFECIKRQVEKAKQKAEELDFGVFRNKEVDTEQWFTCIWKFIILLNR